jgi:helix-turn-helix protein
MSDGEEPIADSIGKFAKVVIDGRKQQDIEWINGRLLLSNKRLVLATDDGKEMIPLSAIKSIKGRQGVGLGDISGYVSVQAESDVTLVAPAEGEDFEFALYGAVLDQQVVLAKHPAVEGGVVQDVDWTKGRLTTEDRTVALALGDGRFVEIEIDDVGLVEAHEQAVKGEERPIIEVEHAEAGTAVETHLSGSRRHVSILGSLLRKGEEQNTAEIDLSDEATEVLMALYSGVSPFQIPEFVGMDVETVEEIYDDLLEAGLLEEVRIRRDVSLKARGRSVASEEMAEE